MSQQIMTVVSLAQVRRRKLGDIEYLSIKEFEGKRVDKHDNQTLTTATETDLATQTASGGKDMYLASASFRIAVGFIGSPTIIMRLFVNGVVVERYEINQIDDSEEVDYTFTTKGVKVETTQIIKNCLIKTCISYRWMICGISITSYTYYKHTRCF